MIKLDRNSHFYCRVRDGEPFIMDVKTARRRMIRRLAPRPHLGPHDAHDQHAEHQGVTQSQPARPLATATTPPMAVSLQTSVADAAFPDFGAHPPELRTAHNPAGTEPSDRLQQCRSMRELFSTWFLCRPSAEPARAHGAAGSSDDWSAARVPGEMCSDGRLLRPN